MAPRTPLAHDIPGPTELFSLDHIVIKSPSVPASLRWAREHGFIAHDGGRHADGMTANVIVSLADGTYIEVVSFIEPSPDAQGRDAHPWSGKPDGVIDWAVAGPAAEAHLAALSGEDAYSPPREGGRRTPDGRDLRWRVTFPKLRPRGQVPFLCEDLTPREWRVPEAGVHPNRATRVKSITLLAQPTRMSQLYTTLVAVLGHVATQDMGTSSDKAPADYPPRERTLFLTTPIENERYERIQITVRDAATEREMAWIAKAGEGIYEVEVACEGRDGRLSEPLTGMHGLRLAPT